MDEVNEYTLSIEKYRNYVRKTTTPMYHGKIPVSCEATLLAYSNAFGGEAGELQNIVKKIIKQDVFFDGNSELHQQFVLEAGDALWYLFKLIDVAGYRVEYVMACNMAKLNERREKEYNETQERIQSEVTP